ncbi:hypothetical protein GOP47_0030989 [Adiantum capillus-veneris]|nr:hypothetical protein GOP47_0030989 [Adiantum capillus-veneris]
MLSALRWSNAMKTNYWDWTKRRQKTSFAAIENERVDRMHEILIAVLRELIGDDSSNHDSLCSDLLGAVHTLKDSIDNYAMNIVDVQVTKLEEQICRFQREIAQLKAQLNKLNAITCRISNVLTRAHV